VGSELEQEWTVHLVMDIGLGATVSRANGEEKIKAASFVGSTGAMQGEAKSKERRMSPGD